MDILELIPAPNEKQLVRLAERLSFAEDEFEEANREQARLYLLASRYRVEMLSLKQRRQAKLDALRAETGLQMRRAKLHQSKAERLTDKAIADAVEVDERVREARRRLERAVVLDEMANRLVEAYRQRQSVLRIITDTRNAEIANEIRSVREGMARDEMRKVSEHTRAVLRRRGDSL